MQFLINKNEHVIVTATNKRICTNHPILLLGCTFFITTVTGTHLLPRWHKSSTTGSCAEPAANTPLASSA